MLTSKVDTKAVTAPPEEQWPAVALAYEFVRPSYDVVLKRLELLEGRARGLITLAVSVTFGVPVFVNAIRGTQAPSYSSLWLGLALSCAAFVVVLGTAIFINRTIQVPDPDLIYQTALDHRTTAWGFQRWALKHAADAFRANRRTLAWKGWASDAMSVALMLELGFMAAWVITGR